MRNYIFLINVFMVLFVFNSAFADTKIIKLKNSLYNEDYANEIIKALRPHLQNNVVITSYKNQLIITADSSQIDLIVRILTNLETKSDIYKISFLTSKFPIKKHAFSTNKKIYTLSVYPNKPAKLQYTSILPLTEINKEGHISKVFKKFASGVLVNIVPINTSTILLNFIVKNTDDVGKTRLFTEQNISSSVLAELGTWQLVGSDSSSVVDKNFVTYSTTTGNYFYVCIEKMQKKSICTVK